MVVTVGFFDGVHIGHRRVLRTLLEKGGSAAVVTMWPHPRVVLQQDAREFKLIDSIEEKTSLIRSCGVDDIRVVPFTKELAQQPAREFVREYLIGELGCDAIVLGYDNRFGGDDLSPDEIAAVCREEGLDVTVVPPSVAEGISVSSTRIRSAITSGDVDFAAKMLGSRYSLEGVVIPGNRLGRTIGFPTANIQPAFPLKVIPANGVYATEIFVRGSRYKAMTNVGVRPTVDVNGARLIETNIFDFDEDIYGDQVTLRFIARMRDEKPFPSLEALKTQLETDRHRCYGYN